MNAAAKRPGPNKIEQLDNFREESVELRVRLAKLWATQLAHYVETSDLQKYPKRHSFPSIVACVESNHIAMGEGIDADDSWESTFFTVRFNGGIVVRMKMLANDANGRLHWGIDGCSVEYPQNEWMRPQEVREKSTLRLGPAEVRAILDRYYEPSLDEQFVIALRSAIASGKKPELVSSDVWEWLVSEAGGILSETAPRDNVSWCCSVRENYNNSGSTLVETVSGRVFLRGVTIEMFI